MLFKTFSAALFGIDAYLVEVAPAKNSSKPQSSPWAYLPAPHDRILKIARGIGDLEGADAIAPKHLSEASDDSQRIRFLARKHSLVRYLERPGKARHQRRTYAGP
jgi:hypothetical protein